MKQLTYFMLLSCLAACAIDEDAKEDLLPEEENITRVYPDTTREEHPYPGTGYTLHIYHDEHLREMQTFYKNGIMEMKIFLRDGIDDSTATWWHENGQMLTQRHYVNGKLNGWHRSWNSDGSLHEELFYRNDTLIKGTQLYMDENFLVDYVEIIEDGKVVRIDSSQRGEEGYKFMELPD